jgi:hypothetical protein
MQQKNIVKGNKGENTNDLVDVKVNVKVKLAALWAGVMFLYVYADIFQLYVPGFIEDIIAGNAPIGSEASLVGASLLQVITSVMIFLSVLLPARASRIANIIVGLFQSVLMVGTFFLPSEAFYYLMGSIEVMITLLIVWSAWNWPRVEDTSAVAEA